MKRKNIEGSPVTSRDPGLRRGDWIKRKTALSPIQRKAGIKTRNHASLEARSDDTEARKKWCPGADLNHRHADFQSAALPLSYPGGSLGKRRHNAGTRHCPIPCLIFLQQAAANLSYSAAERSLPWQIRQPGQSHTPRRDRADSHRSYRHVSATA